MLDALQSQLSSAQTRAGLSDLGTAAAVENRIADARADARAFDRLVIELPRHLVERAAVALPRARGRAHVGQVAVARVRDGDLVEPIADLSAAQRRALLLGDLDGVDERDRARGDGCVLRPCGRREEKEDEEEANHRMRFVSERKRRQGATAVPRRVERVERGGHAVAVRRRTGRVTPADTLAAERLSLRLLQRGQQERRCVLGILRRRQCIDLLLGLHQVRDGGQFAQVAARVDRARAQKHQHHVNRARRCRKVQPVAARADEYVGRLGQARVRVVERHTGA